MNDFIRERYEVSMERICRFHEEESVPALFQAYFVTMAGFIKKCDEVLRDVKYAFKKLGIII